MKSCIFIRKKQCDRIFFSPSKVEKFKPDMNICLKTGFILLVIFYHSFSRLLYPLLDELVRTLKEDDLEND